MEEDSFPVNDVTPSSTRVRLTLTGSLVRLETAMIKLNVHEAKTHLSRYLARLARGESILLCKRNVPIAEIRPLSQPRKHKRSIGLGKGKFKVPRKFFEPLPKRVLDSFHPKGE